MTFFEFNINGDKLSLITIADKFTWKQKNVRESEDILITAECYETSEYQRMISGIITAECNIEASNKLKKYYSLN